MSNFETSQGKSGQSGDSLRESADFHVRQINAFPSEQISLADDEVILHSETRGANRLTLFVGTPVGSDSHDDTYACGAETKDGSCGRDVDSANERCWQHEDDERVDEITSGGEGWGDA